MTEPRDAEAIGEDDVSEEPGVDEKEAADAPPEPVEDAEGLPTEVRDGTIEDHAS